MLAPRLATLAIVGSLLAACAEAPDTPGPEARACAGLVAFHRGESRRVEVLSHEIDLLGKDRERLVSGGWSDPGSDLYPRPIGFNVIPQAGSFTDAGYTDEEWKLVNETRKILDSDDILVEPTCFRVPVMVGHGIAATMYFRRAVDLDEAL